MKYPLVYATSKFEVEKIQSPLHFPLKPNAVLKRQRASKVPSPLQEKVNRLINVLEHYEIKSPAKKQEKPKEKNFINTVNILAKGEPLKIVPDANYLSSLIDESNCNRPIEPIPGILTKTNGELYLSS